MAGRRRAVCVACNRTPERSFVCSKVHGVDLLPHRHGSLRWFSLAGLSALIACVLLFTVCVRASESPVLISGTGKETVKKQQQKKSLEDVKINAALERRRTRDVLELRVAARQTAWSLTTACGKFYRNLVYDLRSIYARHTLNSSQRTV